MPPHHTAGKWQGLGSSLAVLTTTLFCLKKDSEPQEREDFSWENFIFVSQVMQGNKDQKHKH